MACVSCENFASRITNVYRDEELKEKYEKLIGYRVLIDCFICDSCNSKLHDFLDFQQNCVKIYKKNNPNFQQYDKRSSASSTNAEGKSEYLILQTCEEVYTNEEHTNQDIDDQYTVFEINTEEKEIEIEEVAVKKKRQRQPDKLKSERLQKCLIIDNPSEENLIMNEELLDTITNDNQDISYKADNLNESQGSKRARKSYTVQQKLEIIEYAEKFSNREAARQFNLNESTIRCFKRQKDVLIKMNPQKSTNRHGTPYWPELEKHLKAWTEKQPVRPKMNDVREEAIKIAKNMGYDNFSGSNTYIFKFMQRNGIEVASPRPRKVKMETT